MHTIAFKVKNYSILELAVGGSVRNDHSRLSCLPLLDRKI